MANGFILDIMAEKYQETIFKFNLHEYIVVVRAHNINIHYKFLKLHTILTHFFKFVLDCNIKYPLRKLVIIIMTNIKYTSKYFCDINWLYQIKDIYYYKWYIYLLILIYHQILKRTNILSNCNQISQKSVKHLINSDKIKSFHCLLEVYEIGIFSYFFQNIDHKKNSIPGK